MSRRGLLRWRVVLRWRGSSRSVAAWREFWRALRDARSAPLPSFVSCVFRMAAEPVRGRPAGHWFPLNLRPETELDACTRTTPIRPAAVQLALLRQHTHGLTGTGSPV